MATFDVELTGGAPWGFSMVGGSDFNQPLNISKVILPHNSADYPSWNEFEYSKIFISNIVISLVDLFIEFLRKLNDQSLQSFKGSPYPNHFIFEMSERVGSDIERLWI